MVEVNYTLLERTFFLVGSILSVILTCYKIKEYFDRPKIQISPHLFITKEDINEFGQERAYINYKIEIVNSGKDVPGRFIVSKGIITYFSSDYFKLGRNCTRKFEGKFTISPLGINIKKLERPITLEIFFQDNHKRKYEYPKITLDGVGSMSYRSTRKTL